LGDVPRIFTDVVGRNENRKVTAKGYQGGLVRNARVAGVNRPVATQTFQRNFGPNAISAVNGAG
jgi:hypothetical protein